MFLKLLLVGLFTVIIMYLVAFSTTIMHIYYNLAIGHLMQACARFALQCFIITRNVMAMFSGYQKAIPRSAFHVRRWVDHCDKWF